MSGQDSNLKRHRSSHVCSSTITRMWKQQCPLTQKRKKVWHIPTMECYSILDKNEMRPFAARKMDLEPVILSDVKPDRKKELSNNIAYAWNLKRKDTNELIYKT